jgi:hypothetical protein
VRLLPTAPGGRSKLLCHPSLREVGGRRALQARKSRALIQWQSLIQKACTHTSESNMLEDATRNDLLRKDVAGEKERNDRVELDLRARFESSALGPQLASLRLDDGLQLVLWQA